MAAPIIAAYEGPAAADVLALADAWSRDSGRPLHVVSVYPGRAPIGIGRVDTEWVAYNRQVAESVLEEARAALGVGVGDPGASGASGNSATSAIDAGSDPRIRFQAVAAESDAHGLHDLMEAAGPGAITLIGSRDVGDDRRTAPSSTADRLLQGAPGPVVLVPWGYAKTAAESGAAPSLTRVAVAYVDTADGAAALAAGRVIATELSAALELVSVLPDTRVRPSLAEPLGYAAEQRAQFAAALAAAAASVDATTRLVEGPVVTALAALQPTDADLLICGSRGYGPARRVLLGGVSSKLLTRARVPVMVVPRG